MSDRGGGEKPGRVHGGDGIDGAGNEAAIALAVDGVELGGSPVSPALGPNGEVSGTGSGTGGGNAGEDYDTDHTAGSNTLK